MTKTLLIMGIYNLTIFAGTVYLIVQHDWSFWWLLLAYELTWTFKDD